MKAKLSSRKADVVSSEKTSYEEILKGKTSIGKRAYPTLPTALDTFNDITNNNSSSKLDQSFLSSITSSDKNEIEDIFESQEQLQPPASPLDAASLKRLKLEALNQRVEDSLRRQNETKYER